MKVLALLLVFTIAVLGKFTGVPHEVRFQNWMEKHNKAYTTQDEYQNRLQIFKDNTDKVIALNAKSMELNSTAFFELGKFADLSAEEFKAQYLLPSYQVKVDPFAEVEAQSTTAAPNAFDWRSTNKVTPVKDQGQCGSCWAFSCTESIESVYIIAKQLTGSNMPPLAPQQIVDCDKNGAAGCNGGDLPTCYRYVISAGGLEKNSDYPYTAKNGACKAVRSKDFVSISNFKYVIPQGSRDENSMASFLAANSPVSIIVDAEPWQHYKSGVMTAAQCGNSLDHAVQAVGYNIQSGYWIVRNSWGPSWGESGYIRLQFNANTCGMTSEVTVPVL